MSNTSKLSILSDMFPEAFADPEAPKPVAVKEMKALDFPENNHRMGLCPDCGSELQAINGCSGGACLVCGTSSCSL